MAAACDTPAVERAEECVLAELGQHGAACCKRFVYSTLDALGEIASDSWDFAATCGTAASGVGTALCGTASGTGGAPAPEEDAAGALLYAPEE